MCCMQNCSMNRQTRTNKSTQNIYNFKITHTRSMCSYLFLNQQTNKWNEHERAAYSRLNGSITTLTSCVKQRGFSKYFKSWLWTLSIQQLHKLLLLLLNETNLIFFQFKKFVEYLLLFKSMFFCIWVSSEVKSFINIFTDICVQRIQNMMNADSIHRRNFF